MFKLKRVLITNITAAFLIAICLANCTKDQYTFLPYVYVNKYIPFATYNNLSIPGNSVIFQQEGYKGLIVVCINPDLNQYMAYDACCPYEKDYSGVITIQPIKNLVSPPYTIFSSDFFGVCNKCGSKFNLLMNGRPDKGPATNYLQPYKVISGFNGITVTN